MTLFEKLSRYALSGALPMHMPGHKRNTGAFPWLSGLAERDITEIPGFDDLNAPEGLFVELEERAARLWGADLSVALVNGSTVGILACVLSALEGEGALLMSRSSHRSVYNAAQLARADTVYLTPPSHPDLGIPLAIDPEAVARALDARRDVRLVCVTSPTYEGVISDIAGIARECHARGVPLLVDEAHGAHLGFGSFPASSVRSGADMSVQSLHKALPSLTQTAMLHINRGLVDPDRVRRYVAMLQTSSPSYLLSASIDGCVDFMEREGGAAADRWLRDLQELRDRVPIITPPCDGPFDPSKLLIRGPGRWLYARLREELGIEPEYTAPTHVLAMTGMGDTGESLRRLADGLITLDPPCPPKPCPPPAPEKVLPIHEAAALPGRPVPLEDAAGLVSGEYVWSYPPGVPLIAPGETVSSQVIRSVRAAFGIHSSRGYGPNSIFCVDLP